MFGRFNSPAGTIWVCYVCILNGSSVLENRRFLSLQLLTAAGEEEMPVADIQGSIGGLLHGRVGWKVEGTALEIGDRNYIIDECTKDFLKITDLGDRTVYLFIAQQSRSFNPF